MIRPFIIDDNFKARCARLREFAEKPENWYRFPGSDFAPGQRPEYVIETPFGFRVVFSITHAPRQSPVPARHLTISVPGHNFPNVAVVFTVAHHLGFTGAEVVDDVAVAPGKWMFARDETEGCVVVQEPYEVAD